jgi:TetR/AcrR family transcriptional repressor of lmrAB and yxaGH operons
MRTLNERADVVPMVAEVFRDLGYDGATFSRIAERTGLGKGSLYHFFPGGKEEMAKAVLNEISSWFETHVFEPLRRDDPREAIAGMWQAVEEYFRSGKRICLVGAFALDETRELFSATIGAYFCGWIEALRDALMRAGYERVKATQDAEEAVLGIQGALVLARATGDGELFARSIHRLGLRLGV